MKFHTSTQAKKSITITIVILLTTLFFFILYHNDNKYTHRASQAVNGILIADGQEKDETSCRFLIKEWAFYPNTLLTPEYFSDGTRETKYSTLVDIGSQSMLISDGTAHGSGTYVMRLKLPDDKQVYALELPEIFSAYRFYIDDSFVLQMGNPGKEDYRPQTQSRILTFEKSGTVTLILAVSDYSHFYSGLIYPPAFGTVSAVNTLRDIRLGACLLIVASAILIGVFSLFLGIRMKQKNTFIFAFLCFAMSIFTSYSLLHSIAALPVFPWYALEISSGYLVTALVILMHNRICRIGDKIRRVVNTAAFCFCILSLVYGLSGPALTLNLIYGYSVLVTVFKIITACYLLFTSYRLFDLHGTTYAPMFYGTVIYAVLFLWSRVLPDFEPIYFGWIDEWGSLVMVISIGCLLWRDMVTGYKANLIFAEEHRQISRQLEMQMEYARLISNRAAKNEQLTQKFRSHLQKLSSMPESTESVNLRNYLSEISDTLSNTAFSPSQTCGQHPAIDALLRYYRNDACEKQIDFDMQLQIPESLPLSDVEVCTILGNLLENAIEGCETQSGRRSITLGYSLDSVFLLVIENTFDGRIRQKNSHFLSRKAGEKNIGAGLESVKTILRKYDGTLNIHYTENIFHVTLKVPFKKTLQNEV